MQYRKFGKTGWDVSVLGFGAMRMPENSDKTVDETKAIPMIRKSIDAGVNYIDTAYVYHNGLSEIAVGRALADGYRKKVKIATKAPMWLIKTPEDYDKFLGEQLKRLNTDHIDFYLFHGLGEWGWKQVKDLGLIGRAEAAKKAGKISHIGFSFHDSYDSFREIIDGYDKWEFCQIQYNYMDIDNQAGTAGLKYAASKGIPVIIMEPLRGGRLSNPPPGVKELFDRPGKKRTPSEWALHWVWDHPEVTTILSGMNTMQQVEENLKSADGAKAGSFSKEELELIDKVREKFKDRTPIPCTKCNYCVPCKNGVNIPRNFELYNDGVMYNDMKGASFSYLRFMNASERANMCKDCKECEEKCPQKIEISGLMPKVHEALEGGKV